MDFGKNSYFGERIRRLERRMRFAFMLLVILIFAVVANWYFGFRGPP